jgi:hypothetical protein
MIDISNLSHEEALALLKKIENLVGEMPSLIEYNRDGGYGRIYDPYSCCSGDTKYGHDEDCSVSRLKQIFGY